MAPQQEQAEALSQLSAADRALAAKQKTCPVTGELLGSMGAPYKVTVKWAGGTALLPGMRDGNPGKSGQVSGQAEPVNGSDSSHSLAIIRLPTRRTARKGRQRNDGKGMMAKE